MSDENQQQIMTSEVDFGSFRNPELAIKEAEMVARVFATRAEKLQLYKQIGTSKHLLIEGWQMLASMYRVTASIESTRPIEFNGAHGWEATAIAIHIPSGQTVSRADALCLDDEDNWGPRPKYDWKEVDGKRVKTQIGTVPTPTQQLRSMAQTRSMSKVYSNLLKFVARMAGFAGTPAEEMTGNEHDHEDRGAGRGPVQQPQRKTEGPVISEAQAKRFYAIAKGARTDESINAFLDRHGFKHSKDITKAKYDQMCADVVKPDPPVQPNATDPIGPANGVKQAAPAGPVADVWPEVVKAWGSEEAALKAINNHGFESWSQVNQADRAAFAIKMIEKAKNKAE